MAISKKTKFIFTLLLILIAAALFFTFCVRIKHVKAGHVGVKADISAFVNDSSSHSLKIVKGFVMYMPLITELQEYPTTIASASYKPFRALTKDGAEFFIESSLSYSVNDNKADLLYKSYHKPLDSISSVDLKNVVQEVCLDVVAQFSSDELIANRNSVDSLINIKMKAKLNAVGLTFHQITTQVEMPQALKDIVELRARSIQNALLANDRALQAEMEAKVKVINANAVRKSDSLINSALTDLSIKKQFVEKWDGKLPVYGETPKLFRDIDR